MRAIILGATGAIGKDLVQELINDDTIEQIAIFVRRDPGINSKKSNRRLQKMMNVIGIITYHRL